MNNPQEQVKATKIKVPVVPKCMQGMVIKHGSKKFIAIEDTPSFDEMRIEELEARESALTEGLKLCREALEKMDKYGFNELDEIEEITRLTRIALTTIDAALKRGKG